MRTFLAGLVVLPYDQRVATRWGELQAYAQLRGRPRPVNDSWIAACCLARDLPLGALTHDDVVKLVSATITAVAGAAATHCLETHRAELDAAVRRAVATT